MKYLMTMLVALCMTQAAVEKDTVTITIMVEGLRNGSGSVSVALFEETDYFPDDEPFKAVEVSASASGSVELVIEDVPNGDYALAVMHDENDNGDIDMNEYGMPMEGFGFSNDAMGDMGPPDFDSAAFTADEDTDLTVNIRYVGG